MTTQTDKVQAAIDEWQAQEHDVYEYRYTRFIICPNCGYENKGCTVEYDGAMFSCHRCEANFKVIVDLSVAYSTA